MMYKLKYSCCSDLFTIIWINDICFLGSYSYVDPNHRIRTVEYVADKQGFHPVTNQHVPDLPSDTPVVAAAKERHLLKFNAIKQAHEVAPGTVLVPSDTVAVEYAKNKHFALYQKIAEEHARMAAELEALERAKKAEEALHGIKEEY